MARAGFFQYDRGKWGRVSDDGRVKFDTMAAPKGATVHSATMIMPWLRKQGIETPAQRGYLDDWKKDFQYRYGLESLNHQRKSAALPLVQQRAINNTTYGRQSENIRDSWNKNVSQANASLAARGVASSGMQDRTIEELGDQYRDQSWALRQQYGDPAQKRIAAQLKELAAGYSIDKKKLNREARLAYENKIDAGEVKVPDKGYYQRDSIWHFRNRDGVEVSLGAKPTKNTPGLAKYLKKRGK